MSDKASNDLGGHQAESCHHGPGKDGWAQRRMGVTGMAGPPVAMAEMAVGRLASRVARRPLLIMTVRAASSGRMGLGGHLVHCTQKQQGAQPCEKALLGTLTTPCAESIDGVYRHCHHEVSDSRA